MTAAAIMVSMVVARKRGMAAARARSPCQLQSIARYDATDDDGLMMRALATIVSSKGAQVGEWVSTARPRRQ
jgi:hypothetical protein